MQVPKGPWFCRKCESQERIARVVSQAGYIKLKSLTVLKLNKRGFCRIVLVAAVFKFICETIVYWALFPRKKAVTI